MFPQLVAGPIVRYADIAQQLQQRSLTLAGMQQGITRFMCGLGKKIILANSAGEAAGLLLDSNLSQLSVAGAWLGILLYALQIYFDFPAIRIWQLDWGVCLVFIIRKISVIPICPVPLRISGGAGIYLWAFSSEIMCTFL